MHPTKEIILQQSYILFMERGYERVSMENIQNSAGLSRGAIYHHFKGKRQILMEVVEEYLLPALSIFSTVSKEGKTTLKQTINKYLGHRRSFKEKVKTVRSYEVKDFYYFKLAFDIGDVFDGFAGKVEELNRLELQGWISVINHAREIGEIKSDIDVETIAKLFMMTPLGLGLEYALYKQKEIDIDEMETIFNQIYEFIKR